MSGPGELDELLAVALDAARQAARLVTQRRAEGVSVADTKSSAVDVVTEADRASEQLIRGVLAQRRPADSVVGEEGDDTDGTSGIRWLVDPIDGTVNFLYGIPAYAVSIAAYRGDQALVGVVLNVATGCEYTAMLGRGAQRDGVPVQVRPAPPLAQMLIGTGFGYLADARELQGAACARLLPLVRDIRRIGSCALDLCAVAEGSLDGYLEEGVNPWDWAAGALIASEAGAELRVCRGRWGGQAVLAASGSGFTELVAATAAVDFFEESTKVGGIGRP